MVHMGTCGVTSCWSGSTAVLAGIAAGCFSSVQRGVSEHTANPLLLWKLCAVSKDRK